MSRIEQALRRRQQDGPRSDRREARDSALRRLRHYVETPIVPAWQLDRFPTETGREPDRPAESAIGRLEEQLPLDQGPLSAPVVPPAPAATFRQFSRVVAGKVVGDRKMDPLAVEQYRRLAASLHHVQVERGTRKVMVTSAVSGEGKTLTALNLALTLSSSYRRRVVLIDANLRSPCLHALLGIANVAGLNEALSEGHQTRPSLLEISPRLSVLPAGHPDPDPMGPLTSPRMALILDEMAEDFDWVIVDTPPVVLLPDTNLLVGMVDGVIVVIEAGSTSCDLIDRALQAVGRQRVLGFVLNGVDTTGAEAGI